ncbi:hypothetical protein IQ241_19815 [Romeria aff. gracilis LEGE 07310]|uniref:Uncharacterized protein n=1 Tax=Vasconcelosia minhoensis LEGE 07310 TaxID=915328 RepID=A0A8J7ARY5_9CYAN|nr:hypothetical protein [Romeria gracilis]MBE9079516.1 hypothetical protein [Romeria aff. gracilis LEGE 07310]
MDELRTGLELATAEELQAMTEILFRPRFNPLDYVATPSPLDVQSCDRTQQIDLLDQRFRFLAADGFTVLRGQTQQVSYRQALIGICQHLKTPYPDSLSTSDLEAELFLTLLEKAWARMSGAERKQLQGELQNSLAENEQFQQLPLSVQQDPLGLLVKGSSALALSSVVRPWLLQQIARQFALHFARYQVAKQVLVKGGLGAAAQIQTRMAAQMASRGMAMNAARYGAMRGLLAGLGPALWTWFLVDLGWRTIATNHGRVIPVVYALAQIRLTRGAACWEMA